MNNGSNENSIVLKYVNIKNVRVGQAARIIIPIKRSSKWMVVVKIAVAVLKCIDVKENSLKMY